MNNQEYLGGIFAFGEYIFVDFVPFYEIDHNEEKISGITIFRRLFRFDFIRDHIYLHTFFIFF